MGSIYEEKMPTNLITLKLKDIKFLDYKFWSDPK